MRYTARQLDYLRKKYPVMKIPALTAAFNVRFGMDKTEGQIKAACQNHKIRCGRPSGNPVGTYFKFTQKQARFIRKNYSRFSIVELTARLNAKYSDSKTEQQLRSFTRNHGITSGRTGYFEKGQMPWNAGTKGLTGRNRTTFKKGNVPATIKPLGSQRVCSKDGYLLVKVAEKNPYTGAPARYRQKHVVLWEKKNGKVPPGKCIAFRDGNNQHCKIRNLMLVDRAELLHLNRHGYKEMPAQLKPTLLALTKLEVKIFKVAKG